MTEEQTKFLYSIAYSMGTTGIEYFTCKDGEKMREIIKALEQQSSEDYISRQAVIEYIKNSDAELGHDSENEIVVEDILNMPPVVPTRKVGKWVKKSQYGNDYCSECDYEHCGYGYPKYCPNCGAEMEEK